MIHLGNESHYHDMRELSVFTLPLVLFFTESLVMTFALIAFQNSRFSNEFRMLSICMEGGTVHLRHPLVEDDPRWDEDLRCLLHICIITLFDYCCN